MDQTRDDGARWYRDVVGHDVARAAWQAEFERQGATVDLRRPTRHHTYGSVGDEAGRHVDLGLWRQGRIRLVLRDGDRRLLDGFAADLPATVGAARRWLGGARPAEVAAAWPFLGSVALAEARERGDVLDAVWINAYENHTGNPVIEPTRPFVALAFHEPRLRALLPAYSHANLWFSRTPTYPFDPAPPGVEPTRRPGRFVVRIRYGRVYDETDAAGALAIVLAELDPATRTAGPSVADPTHRP